MLLLRMVLIGVLAFILIRMVQAIFRVLNSSGRYQDDDRVANQPTKQQNVQSYVDIKDATFEDVQQPKSKPTDDTTGHPSEQ